MSKLTDSIFARAGASKQKHRSLTIESASVLEEAPTYARIIVKPGIGVSNGISGLSQAEMASFVAGATGNRARLVEGTMLPTEQGAISAFVALNREVAAIEEANADGWTQTGSSTFADPQDNMWEVANNMLVRVADDQLEEIISERSRRMSTSVVLASTGNEGHFAAGSILCYFNPGTEKTHYGIYTGDGRAYNVESASFEVVEPVTVLAAGIPDRAIPKSKLEELASGGVREALDYFKILYSNNKEMFAQLKASMQQYLMV